MPELALADTAAGGAPATGLAGDAARIMASQAVALVAGLPGSAITARFLGPRGRGLLALVGLARASLFLVVLRMSGIRPGLLLRPRGSELRPLLNWRGVTARGWRARHLSGERDVAAG